MENLGYLVLIADGSQIKLAKAFKDEDRAKLFADGFAAGLEEVCEEDGYVVEVLEISPSDFE